MKIMDPKEKRLKYPITQLIKDIWQNAGSSRTQLIAGTIFQAVADVAGLYMAVALGKIVTQISIADGSFKKVLILLAIWFATVSLRYLGIYYARKNIFITAEKMWLDTEKKMLSVLFSKDSAWHENDSSGIKINRIEKGSKGYNEILRAWVGTYISVIVRFIGIPIVLLSTNSLIGWSMVFFIVTYFAIAQYMQKRCIAAAHEYNVAEEKVSGVLVETVTNIRTIRFLNIGPSLLARASVFMRSTLLAAGDRIDAFQSRFMVTSWYARFFSIVVIGYISYGVMHGKYEIGLIVLFSTFFFDIWTNLNDLTNASQDTIVAQQSIARMYQLVGRDIPPETGTQKFPEIWDAIKIEKLSFSYGANEALRDITFSIKKGEKVGIVGLSGAGKSTLFKLLLKERADYTGDIKIGAISIPDIKDAEYYQHVSIVPQDTEVFNFSLKENISIVNPDAKHDSKLLDKAMEVSHVKDFLHKLPEGVDTLIGERGVKLSGGERQRLGIARAIYRRPEILLLDEATSHLDLESEEKIKDSLHKFFEGITALVIAHRLTTIREMDKIIVIEKGRILEQGSFDELMEKKGRFSELWMKQKFD
jgi:ABC-type multidrug transport system fused ATPase/permease subunit